MLVVNRSVKKEIVNNYNADISGMLFIGTAVVSPISLKNGKAISTSFDGLEFYTEHKCDFDGCDCSNSSWNGTVFNPNSVSFKGTNFTGAIFLEPVTKAAFILNVGIQNFSAETLWIDGTSILAP